MQSTSFLASPQQFLSKSQDLSIFAGTLLEAYDNFLFIALLPILTPLFFPDSSSFQTQILAYSAFACSYLGRPFGSLVFGHIGDRYGRLNALSLSILMISFFTCILAFLPTYGDIGQMATLLFVTTRFFQGFCYGGETIGSTITFVETSRPDFANRRANYTSCSVLVGGLVASGIGTLVTSSLYPTFSWRCAFLAGAIMGLVGLYIRLKAYKHAKEITLEKIPLRTAVKNYRLKLFYPFLITAGVLVPFCIIFVYAPIVLKNTYALSEAEISNLRIFLMFTSLALLPLMGFLADLLGPNKMIKFSIRALLIMAIGWAFVGTFISAFWGFILLLFGLSIAWTSFSGPSNLLVIKYFPPSMRYSALGLSLSYGILLFSMTPMFLAFLDEMNFGFFSITLVLVLTGVVCSISSEKLMVRSK